ncbi:hypothetical protein HN51_070321 [Arachis hypogaea]
MFAKQNWFENKDKNRNVIIRVGLPSMEENSIWFTRTNVDCPQQIPLNIPIVINQFGWYLIIGSCHGVHCIQFSQEGLDSSLLIWNPLIQQFHTISDEARQHCCHVVSLYAFGFLNHSMEYCIVHVYKKHYSDTNMSWSLYSSNDNYWTHSGIAQTQVQKLSPKSIVVDGFVYWIGWNGLNFTDPSVIAVFSL